MIHLWAPGVSDFGGGINAFSRELARAIRIHDPDLHLYSKHDRQSSWEALPLTTAAAAPDALRTPYFALRLFAGALRETPSMILSTHLNFGPAARTVAAALGIPYVLAAHGVEVHPELSRARAAALRSATMVWAVSRWTARRLEDLGVSEDRIAVVGNTVDHVRFDIAPDPAALRQRYGLQPEEKVILTVARMDASEGYKGHEALLRALPAVRAEAGPVRSLIVGTGDARRAIEDLASSSGVGNLVTFCGFVSDDELPDHYRLADVFAMPSRGEGFGIVFLEAMACGTPVLGGNADGTADALADGELGELIDPGDERAIAAALVRLIRREGPSSWYDKHALRLLMLERHGREKFAARVSAALACARQLADPARVGKGD